MDAPPSTTHTVCSDTTTYYEREAPHIAFYISQIAHNLSAG